MTDISQSFSMSAEQLAKGEQAVRTLYDKKELTNVNTARHRMVGTQTTDPCKLPPCQRVVQNHLWQVNYQAAIWKRCLENCPDIPSPHGRGWVFTNSEVAIKWPDVSPTAMALIECQLQVPEICGQDVFF